MLSIDGVHHAAKNLPDANKTSARSGKPQSNYLSGTENPHLLWKAEVHYCV
jgi:hypothetical protein